VTKRVTVSEIVCTNFKCSRRTQLLRSG